MPDTEETIVGKITKINDNGKIYEIDLPSTATPTVASLTITGEIDNDNKATTKKFVEDSITDLKDAIDARSDVVDVVSTKAALNNYDTTSLTENDVIKVLKDESENNKTSYYKWSNSAWTLVGSIDQYILNSQIKTSWASSTSNSDVPSEKLVKDTLDTKQATLVSGTNIKTIENQSILGSGNIDLTKSDVGLSNVDNTSDIDKPVSTATQTALNAKQNTLETQNAYSAKGSSYKVPQITTNTLGQVTLIEEQDISTASINNITGSESISVNTSSDSSKTLNVVTRDTTQFINSTKLIASNQSLAFHTNNTDPGQMGSTGPRLNYATYAAGAPAVRVTNGDFITGNIKLSSGGIFYNSTNDAYSLRIPTMTSWTANKTIATDEDVVHKTGDEEISGTKTFKDVGPGNPYTAISKTGVVVNNTLGSNTNTLSSTDITLTGAMGKRTSYKNGQIEYQTNSQTDTITYNFPNAGGTLALIDDIPAKATDVNEYGKFYVSPTQVRQFQQTFGIVPDLLHNINGHDLSNTYNTTNITVGGYPAVKIRNISDNSNLDFNEAHNYMRKLTGSEYTPIYGDGTVPQFSYIVDGTGKFYKAQYDNTNGLLLYPVSQLALNSTVVHNTGNETINGVKTFSNNIYSKQNLQAGDGTSEYASYSSRAIALGNGSSPSTILILPTASGSHTLATLDDITGGSGSDLVRGPSSSILGNIATYSDTTGKTIKDSGINISSDSSYTTLKVENKTLRLTAGFGYGGGYLNMYMDSSGLNVYPTAQGTYPKNLGTQNGLWTNVYAENVSGGSNGLILFAPGSTSVSLEMDDGTIDFKDRNKSTSAQFDLSGLSNNTSYYYHFPAKSGTLATENTILTYSTVIIPSSNFSNIDLTNDVEGFGYYHIQLRCQDSGTNNYANIGVVRLHNHNYTLNNANDRFQYLGSTIIMQNGTTVKLYYVWVYWLASSSFALRISTTIPDAESSSANFVGTAIFTKIGNI